MQQLSGLSFAAQLRAASPGDWVRYYVAGAQAKWCGGTIERIQDPYVWLVPVLSKGVALPVHFSHVSELQSGSHHWVRR